MPDSKSDHISTADKILTARKHMRLMRDTISDCRNLVALSRQTIRTTLASLADPTRDHSWSQKEQSLDGSGHPLVGLRHRGSDGESRQT